MWKVCLYAWGITTGMINLFSKYKHTGFVTFQGDLGDIGPTGEPGPPGQFTGNPKGSELVKGDKGDDGIKGEPGDMGSIGLPGLPGNNVCTSYLYQKI